VTSELFEHLRDQAERRPDAVALLVDGEPSSYRRLLEDAESLARGLSSLGVRRGDRVTLHLANLPELFIAYHACFRIGALACPLNTRLTASELRPVLELVRPTVHLGGTALVDRLGDALGSLIPADTCYLVGDGPMPAGTRVFADLFLAHDQGVRTDVAGMDREDGADAGAWQDEPAVLLGTSGTTGEIKLVAHTQATLSAAAQTLGRGPIGDDAVALDTSPMVHAGGLTFVLAQLGKGVSIAVLSRPATGQGVLDAVERDRCGFVGGLPVIFSQMLQAQREHPRDLSSLRHCISGGDVVDEDVQRGFREEIGVRLHQMWSATEVPGGMTYGLEDGPVSRTLEGTDVRLVDAARHDVARGQSGELLVQNTVVAQGYWRGPGDVEPFDPPGWFATGDVFVQGQDRDLRFVARAKELIVRGGSNVAPAEVELALRASPDVSDAAVVGLPDAALGQRVVALVVPEGDARDAAFSRLDAFLRERLAGYKIPEEFLTVDELPRTPMGKVDHRAAASLAAQRAGSSTRCRRSSGTALKPGLRGAGPPWSIRPRGCRSSGSPPRPGRSPFRG